MRENVLITNEEENDVVTYDRGFDFLNEPDLSKLKFGVDGPPELRKWEPRPEDEYFTFDGSIVTANYVRDFKINPETKFQMFIIKKNHYKNKMDDIVKHINYFLTFFDPEKEFYLSIFRAKWNVDNNDTMSLKSFRHYMNTEIVTDSVIEKILNMAKYLYRLNVDTDRDGKYSSTPKIDNAQARLTLAISFCYRLIMPICVHYSNTNVYFVDKKSYIPKFEKIYMDILMKFEKADRPVYETYCEFVNYRNQKNLRNDRPIWEKKKQIRGTVAETQLMDTMNEVILVKSMYKLDYDKSPVGFIDGITGNDYKHFKNENFKNKPIAIETVSSDDSDDYLSNAESLEMMSYRVDESNTMLSEANIDLVMNKLRKEINVDISKEEFDFYMNNCKLNILIQEYMHSFYSRYFDDTNAIYALSRENTILLLILMKKYLQARGMTILPIIITSRVNGKFKENMIKNRKFLEKLESSSVYQKIILPKFKFIAELGLKDDIINKLISTMLNSSFKVVDFDALCQTPSNVNGLIYEDVNVDVLMQEFLLFLTII